MIPSLPPRKLLPVALLAVMLLLSAVGLNACTEKLERVEPWEREKLAGDLMNPDLNTMEERNWNHIYFSKEGGYAEFGGGGGGCGCN